MNDNQPHQSRSAPGDVKWLILDVDGVLTDGRLYVDNEGRELLAFSIQDGLAIRLWQRTGRRVGLLSGRDVPAIRGRAEQLKIDLAVLGQNDKLGAYKHLLKKAQVTEGQVAYVGDDLLDLPVMACCGYPIAVANAVDPVKAAADYVTVRPGGHGAVAEVVQHLLSLAGEWQAHVAAYRRGDAGKQH